MGERLIQLGLSEGMGEAAAMAILHRPDGRAI